MEDSFIVFQPLTSFHNRMSMFENEGYKKESGFTEKTSVSVRCMIETAQVRKAVPAEFVAFRFALK